MSGTHHGWGNEEELRKTGERGGGDSQPTQETPKRVQSQGGDGLGTLSLRCPWSQPAVKLGPNPRLTLSVEYSIHVS